MLQAAALHTFKEGELIGRVIGDLSGLTTTDAGIPGNGARVALHIAVTWQATATLADTFSVGVGQGTDYKPLAVCTPGAPCITLDAARIGDLLTVPLHVDDSGKAAVAMVTEVYLRPRGV